MRKKAGTPPQEGLFKAKAGESGAYKEEGTESFMLLWRVPSAQEGKPSKD